MIEKLIRPHLKSFQPYVSARSEVQEAKLFLDANELSLGNLVSFDGVALNRYPDPLQIELRSKLAKRLGITPEMVFTGVGSDEIIDLLIRLFCEPVKDSICILEPTYGVYRVSANMNNIQILAVELDEYFHIDIKKTLSVVNTTTKIIFLCSPNNPTGNLLRRDDIVTLCRESNAIVVLDQAYIEFANPSGDLTSVVSQLENLIILRTLSKAWGLAGIRLGFCIANPLIISYLQRIKAPYNINVLTTKVALGALANSKFLSDSVQCIQSERERLTNELGKLTGVVRVFQSNANFLLVEFKDAKTTYDALYRKGIIIRRRSEERMKNCLRITIGTQNENNLLLSMLKECE